MQLQKELIVCNFMKKLFSNIKDEAGQSTVEFAIVTAAMLVVVLALGLF